MRRGNCGGGPETLNNLRRKLRNRENGRAWLGKGKDSKMSAYNYRMQTIPDQRVREYTVHHQEHRSYPVVYRQIYTVAFTSSTTKLYPVQSALREALWSFRERNISGTQSSVLPGTGPVRAVALHLMQLSRGGISGIGGHCQSLDPGLQKPIYTLYVGGSTQPWLVSPPTIDDLRRNGLTATYGCSPLPPVTFPPGPARPPNSSPRLRQRAQIDHDPDLVPHTRVLPLPTLASTTAKAIVVVPAAIAAGTAWTPHCWC
ncbi:hypothetical protein DFH94DRAFT_845841 [Russula ochroleuca]|uniref:Uncharacterized protein n=1 Tax=Russula ochroleuca TaxID=152965 RepID=A0A9P5MSX1_9AGAM|nr:hypothetical protein DFH94DRAFT_845841 [Russula ochroleuca]